jgi:hypothetical protein
MSHLYDGEQPEETHLFDDVETEPRITDDLLPVSYTHLTLPTNSLV